MENAKLTMTFDEACAALGTSRDTLRRLIADREVPAFRMGRGQVRGKILIRREALEKFIAGREAAGV